MVNDRWGHGDQCINGGYLTCHDRYNPGMLLYQEMCKCHLTIVGVLQKRKWEDADTLDKSSWGYQRNIPLQGYHTTDDLIHLLVTVVR